MGDSWTNTTKSVDIHAYPVGLIMALLNLLVNSMCVLILSTACVPPFHIVESDVD